MKISAILFAILIGMCLLLGYVLMTEEPGEAHGIPHPDYASMERGGDGRERLAPIFWAGWLLGVLQIFFYVALLAFGARKTKSFPLETRALVAGALVYAGVFTWMVISYSGFAADPGEVLLLSFPPPTALMLYGVGFTPLLFIGLYLWRFEPWIIDDEELAGFLEQVRNSQDARVRNSQDD